MARGVLMIRAIANVVAAAVFGCGAPAWCGNPSPAARLPVPAADAVTKSRELVRAAFEADYRAAKELGEPAPLLDKLRRSADTADEPIKTYAFLLEAEDVAAQHDDATATLALVDRRADLFEIDGLAERAKSLARLASPKIVADMALLEQAMATATKAAAAERFDIATDSAVLAVKVAQAIDRDQKAVTRRRLRKPAPDEVVPAANGIPLIKSAMDVKSRIIEQKERFQAYEEAKAVLAATPDDATANAAAGTYLCFAAQKWDAGLTLLAKGGLPTVSDLAREEVLLKDEKLTDVERRFALAGKWWDTAETMKSLDDSSKDAIKRHAATIYGNVVGKLPDPLKKQVAENRGRQYAAEVAETDPLREKIDVERHGHSPRIAEPSITNSVGITLRQIPAGSFAMGSEDGNVNEKPLHRVQITRPFYLGATEVTNAQWRVVMGGEPPSRLKDADRPVEQVSWNDAVEFCRKLSLRPEELAAGRVYRLPTEAEWEYACRAGTTTEWSSGDDEKSLEDVAWFESNSGNETHPVAHKKPNAWGLHDMHGNVWEWCSDWQGPFAAGEVSDPTGPVAGSDRSRRGGSWCNIAAYCRSADRRGLPAAVARYDGGFRLAVSLPSAQVSDSNAAYNGDFEAGLDLWELRNATLITKDSKAARSGENCCLLGTPSMAGLYQRLPLSWGDTVTIGFWAEPNLPHDGGGELWLYDVHGNYIDIGPTKSPVQREREQDGWTHYSVTIRMPDRIPGVELPAMTKAGIAILMNGRDPMRLDDVEIHVRRAARPPTETK
jgi:formylglycine-generating enzyme required for sulfatase activity